MPEPTSDLAPSTPFVAPAPLSPTSDPDRGFSAILDLIRGASGMEFTEGRLAIAERRLDERRLALGGENGPVSWDEYRTRLSADPAEMRRVIELLAVNETFFYRHRAQLVALRDRVLAPLAAEARLTGRPVRIWSAACANGCEPYTLAILCLEIAAVAGPFPFEVVGTDIDSGAIADAVRGVYSEREVSVELPPMLRDAFFTARQDGMWEVRDVLREKVRFQQGNLLVDPLPSNCRLVVCRNVLYYFPEVVRRRVLSRIWNALCPGDVLIVAPTESVLELEPHFRILDAQQKLLEHWSTAAPTPEAPLIPTLARNHPASRTIHPGSRTNPSSAAPVRIPPEWRRVLLSGSLMDSRDLHALRAQLVAASSAETRTAELFAAPPLASSDLVLDASRLQFISNDLLAELRTLLAEAQARRRGASAGAPPQVRMLVCPDAGRKAWFERAGFRHVLADLRTADEVTFIAETASKERVAHGGRRRAADAARETGTRRAGETGREPKPGVSTPTPARPAPAATPSAIPRSASTAPIATAARAVAPRPASTSSSSTRPASTRALERSGSVIVRLPVDAHRADPAAFQERLAEALVRVERGDGVDVVVEAKSCIFLDETHARMLSRFLGVLPPAIPTRLLGAALPVARLIHRYVPAERWSR